MPGVAGIVLTLGMAIDANVLICERVREELRNGSSPHAAIRAGYEKAWSTILDANVTHLIAALCDMTRNQKRITAKEKVTDNDKYAFRCFLLRLGFIGAEFKDERKILLRDLSGNSAFKSGQRRAEALQSEPPASADAMDVQGDPELAEALADELLVQQVNASFGEEAAS